ncbi:MAG TPA: hypothetical protein VHB77_22825 [Planctomycetaceae bacterium]|jgi:hypothetical protein|nr:hypothetical protein [Planctomycetaceae bacterium]
MSDDSEPLPEIIPPPGPPPAPSPDLRLYAPEDGWKAHIKRGWDNDYCYAAYPGQDYFHLLLNGEIFIQRGDEKYCLNCAVRLGYLTANRLYWQKGGGPQEL